MTPTFQTRLTRALHSIPAWGWGSVAAMALLETILDFRPPFPAFSAPGWAVSVATMVGWLSVFFAVSIAATGQRRSWRGFWRYAVTTVAVIAPLAIALILMIVAARLELTPLTLLAAIAILPAGVIAALLAGWPLVQAIEHRWIGAGRALAATRGLRWPLVIAAFVFSGLDRLNINPAEVRDIVAVVIGVAWNGFVNTLGSMAVIIVSLIAAAHMKDRLPMPEANDAAPEPDTPSA